MNIIKRYDFLNFVIIWSKYKLINNKRSRKKIAPKYHSFMFWCDQTNQGLDRLSNYRGHNIYRYIFNLYKQYKVYITLENLRKNKIDTKQKMLNKISAMKNKV